MGRHVSEPLPPVETVEDAMRHASEQLRALKKAKPQNAAEARLHSAELVRLQQELISATHRATDAAAAKRLNGSNGAQPAKGLSGFTASQVGAVMRILAAALTPYFNALDKRLAALEQHAVKYEGIWDETKTYSSGSLITFAGGLWHCTDTNVGVRPGSGSSSWTLANKSRR